MHMSILCCKTSLLVKAARRFCIALHAAQGSAGKIPLHLSMLITARATIIIPMNYTMIATAIV